MKSSKQADAIRLMQDLLRQRNLNISSRAVGGDNNHRWEIFEHGRRQVGIDAAASIWIRESDGDPWRCAARPCTVSGAVQAVEFLVKP